MQHDCQLAGVDHAALALLRAMRAQQCGGMKTKTLHAEVLYQLYISTSINESLTTYGIKAESTTSIVCVSVDASPEEEATLDSIVDGDRSPLNALSQSAAHQSKLAKAAKCTDAELGCIGGVEAAVNFRAAVKNFR
eukprot:GHVU01147208.1.p3 GENE.GHVU01147208.1~~GHVU01147208.1.p3  ORF type:complete len:136 (+),score=23.42 GHVU01147208.1:594-1001(+)